MLRVAGLMKQFGAFVGVNDASGASQASSIPVMVKGNGRGTHEAV
jgi:ABC-type branched-subunit amino acid transport system ATPase component